MTSEKSYETHIDETLAMVGDTETDAPLATVYDFPMKPAAEAAKSQDDPLIKHYGETVKNRTASHSEGYRFTDRAKRLGAGIIATVTLGGVLAAGMSQNTNAENENRNIPTRIEVADKGETVWGIAQTSENVGDTRTVVHWMEQNNPNLSDGLDVGETVKVPLDAKDIK